VRRRRIHRRHPAGAVRAVVGPRRPATAQHSTAQHPTAQHPTAQHQGGDGRQLLLAGVLPGAESARQAAGLLALQRQAGNRAVAHLVNATQLANRARPVNAARLVTAARPTAATVAAGGITVHGETSGTYDGGVSKIANSRARRAANCRDCPPEQGCVRATGTLVIDYHVDVTIRMPDMPGGLTQCQQRRVRAFLRNVLQPHENDHARRLRTYNGTTSRPFDITACGRDAVQERLQEMHETEATKRASDADARSAAIDPFTREIDLDCT
jgi:hypothetical protein